MSTATVPDSIFDRSRMSLIRVEQVVARRVDGLRELDLLAGEVAGRVLRELVERISRLFSGVRSSCDMLARNSDLYFEVSASCLAFSSSACRACSTSRVLALDLDVLLGQQLGLLLELLVGVLQFLLLELQLVGQRLRLLQQVLRARVGLDRVQDDADALGELVEERLVRRVELVEARPARGRP